MTVSEWLDGRTPPGPTALRARIDDARRNLAVAKLEDYIKRTVDAAPPLTVEQRDRLALLLTSGAA